MMVNGSVLLSSPPGGDVGAGVGHAAPIARKLKRLTRPIERVGVLIFGSCNWLLERAVNE